MATTINADTIIGGAIVTADTSGELELQSAGVSKLRVTGSGVSIPGAGTVVDTTGTQTLTNKTISNGTFSDGYTEETVTANTGTAYTIDLANGTLQILTMTGNVTFTFPTPAAGKSFLMMLKQDGTGSRTVSSWGATTKWAGGTSPTLTTTAGRMDIFSFVSDGTNWYGATGGQNYTV